MDDIKLLKQRAEKRYLKQKTPPEQIRRVLTKEDPLTQADIRQLEAYVSLPTSKLSDLILWGNIILNDKPIEKTTITLKKKQNR